MSRTLLFMIFLAAGLPVIVLNLAGQIDDRISARILGVLTITMCGIGLVLERKRKPR